MPYPRDPIYFIERIATVIEPDVLHLGDGARIMQLLGSQPVVV